MSHIEWNEVALDEGVRALADLLRSHFGVWVGIARSDGNNTPLGSTGERGGPGLCASFTANPSRSDLGSCRASVASWVDDAELPQVRSCHAGLAALIHPLHGLEAAIYVSGFLEGESAYEQGRRIDENLDSLDLADEARERLLGQVPHLDRNDREMARLVAEAIAGRVVAIVDGSRLDGPENFEKMLGASDVMLKLFKTLRRVARSNSTVLIQGENGTGKELIARAIHRHSRRSDRPFIVQNCAAIPAELIESELFGHRKGAFSGAHRDRDGLFTAADGGTFFLDEIGDMPIQLQVKLLRILQEGTFLPVGGNTFQKVDVRIVCATNRNLEALVDEGTFRQDLFYRINVVNIESPPLRHRRDDIPLLARHFAAKAARLHGRPAKTLTEEVIDDLKNHTWPGNVRELENEVERAVIMSGDKPMLEPLDFDLRRTSAPGGDFQDVSRSNVELPAAIEQLERTMILEGLKRTGWNKTQTAKELGISRRNLIRKVATYELEELKSS